MVDGILLVDKPKGWTSFDVCNFVKKRFGIEKVGHTGTLDPIATGLLVLVMGRFTRMQEKLSQLDKVYEGVFTLGATTDTQDAEGKILTTDSIELVTPDQIMETTAQFKGDLEQIPPMYSAVKFEGKRLYKLARAGKEVERQARAITIHSLDISEIRLPDVRFRIHCSKGTYVRTIAHDFGQKLNCGAYLKELVRTATGEFQLGQAVTVDQLKQIESREELRAFFYRHTGENCYLV
jgi:tRNA pseudouridine55 synthase